MVESKGTKVFQVFNNIFLLILSFVFVFPFWRIIAISFNDGIDASRGGINFFPRKFTLDNYIVIFSRHEIIDAYTVTIARAVIGTVLSVFLTSLMAYGLSKNCLRGRKIINIMLIITMFFSGGMIPNYLLFNKLHLLDSFWVYIIPSLYTASWIFIFRSFFRSLPAELEESARMDGANDLLVFFRIVYPLSLPIIVTMALFIAVGHWNDYMAGILYVTKRKLFPLQTMLYYIVSQNDSSKMLLQGGGNLASEKISHVTMQSVRMATLVAVIVPIVCVYPFLQKYFVKGVMIGSLKG